MDVGNILLQACYEGLVFGLVTIGIYITFRVLSFPDLSVDGTFPLGAATAAVLIHVKGIDPFAATLAGFGAGLGAGFITGLLNTKLRISALLAGILMMVGLYSVNLRIMGRANIPLLRDTTVFDIAGDFLGISGKALSITVVLVVVFVVLAVLYWFLRTEIGLALRATGDNEQMVRSLGGDTDKAILLGCSISNGLVALSGALVAQDWGFADVGIGIGMIVMGLAALIIGEGILRPRGIAWVLLACLGGTFIYRLFLGIALELGMAPGDLKLITAALVIFVLAIPYIRKRIRREWVPPAVRW